MVINANLVNYKCHQFLQYFVLQPCLVCHWHLVLNKIRSDFLWFGFGMVGTKAIAMTKHSTEILEIQTSKRSVFLCRYSSLHSFVCSSSSNFLKFSKIILSQYEKKYFFLERKTLKIFNWEFQHFYYKNLVLHPVFLRLGRVPPPTPLSFMKNYFINFLPEPQPFRKHSARPGPPKYAHTEQNLNCNTCEYPARK